MVVGGRRKVAQANRIHDNEAGIETGGRKLLIKVDFDFCRTREPAADLLISDLLLDVDEAARPFFRLLMKLQKSQSRDATLTIEVTRDTLLTCPAFHPQLAQTIRPLTHEEVKKRWWCRQAQRIGELFACLLASHDSAFLSGVGLPSFLQV